MPTIKGKMSNGSKSARHSVSLTAQRMPHAVTSTSSTYSSGEKELYAFWVPVLLTIILSYAIAAAFMNVLGLAIDTILLCFCVDIGRDGAGTMAKPYFASKSMLKAIGKGDAVSHEDNPGAAADDGSGTKMM